MKKTKLGSFHTKLTISLLWQFSFKHLLEFVLYDLGKFVIPFFLLFTFVHGQYTNKNIVCQSSFALMHLTVIYQSKRWKDIKTVEAGKSNIYVQM